MKLTRRCLLFAGVSTAAYIGQAFWLHYAQPQLATPLAVAQLQSGTSPWRNMLAWQASHQLPSFVAEGIVLAAALWCFVPPLVTGCCALRIERNARPKMLPGILAMTLVHLPAHAAENARGVRWIDGSPRGMHGAIPSAAIALK